MRAAQVAPAAGKSCRIACDSVRSADELIYIQTILLPLDQMGAPADEMEPFRERLKNLSADQGDRLGVGINRLAQAL